MPIYEFYCDACNTVFQFLSRRINTTARPACPTCHRTLQRHLSSFATIGKAREPGEAMLGNLDEAKMEQIMADMAREAEHVNPDDPQQMARMMRTFSEKTGIDFGEDMAEALKRLESGEDPEQIEAEMGDLLEDAEPSLELRHKGARPKRPAPFRDDTLYEL